MTLGSRSRGSLYSYRELLKNLVIKDLKLKYRGSVFGFLWSLVNPLLMIVVYTLAFTFILRIRSERFIFYLMLGQLGWTFFANSVDDVHRRDRRQCRPAQERVLSAGHPADRHGAVQPRAVPADHVRVSAVDARLVPVPLVEPMILFPGRPRAAGRVHHRRRDDPRDRHGILPRRPAPPRSGARGSVLDDAHRLRADRVPERLRLLILLSPMSPFVVAYQKLFFFREWPEPTVWLVAATYAVGAFVVGTALVLAFEDRFAEQL